MSEDHKMLFMPQKAYEQLIDDFALVHSFLQQVIYLVQRSSADNRITPRLLDACARFGPQAEKVFRRWIVPLNGQGINQGIVIDTIGDVDTERFNAALWQLSGSVEAMSSRLLDTHARAEGLRSYLDRLIVKTDELLEIVDERDWPAQKMGKEEAP